MISKERKQDLLTKMKHIGYDLSQRIYYMALFNTKGRFLRKYRRNMEDLIDDHYRLTNELVQKESESKENSLKILQLKHRRKEKENLN